MDLIEVSENKNRHPWELSRTKSIINQLEKLNITGNRKILDIGCGDSYFDRCLISSNPELEIYGVDINLKEEFYEKKIHGLNSFEHIPNIKFDFVIMMDVLEHIEDDKSFLNDIKSKYLKDDGILFITVPAFMKLFSLHDKELKHFRRYNHKMLSELINSCGLEELDWSYFYFSLLIGRLFTMNKTKNLGSWQKPSDSFLTKSITSVLNIDFKVLKALSSVGIHLPGLSLMAVCCKK